MDLASYRYCKIFVDGADVDAVKATLAGALGGTFDRYTMHVLQSLAIDVRRNSDATEPADQDDFVYWPVLVELDAEDDAAANLMVDVTAKILNSLWDTGYRAVAACDFEDELPWSGGIRRIK